MNKIVKLNVGGVIFQTSEDTLLWAKESFFANLLDKNFEHNKDEYGNFFIDRDPDLFKLILNYLRTKELPLESLNVAHNLMSEAEYYGIVPMVKRLASYIGLNERRCGSIYFNGFMVREGSIFKSKNLIRHSIDLTDQPPSSISAAKLHSILLISAHNNYVAASTATVVSIFNLNITSDWEFLYNTPPIDDGEIHKLAINVKVPSLLYKKLISFCNEYVIYLYDITRKDSQELISKFPMLHTIDFLFFTSSHLVALRKEGSVACWHSVSQKWKVQETLPFSCCDSSQNLLIIACENNSIKGIDLEKFPLRMIDDGLLITDVYNAPHVDKITTISLYTRLHFQLRTNGGYWLEFAYGTQTGSVYVISHHPQAVGTDVRVFHALHVHNKPLIKVILCEKYLFTMCDDGFHVRTYALSRFRDMLNTQPGPITVASFNIADTVSTFGTFLGKGCCKGPYFSGDGRYFFVEHLQPHDTLIKIKSSITGQHLCTIHSADNSVITSYNVNSVDPLASSSGSKPALYFFTGHQNGTIQVWDMSLMIDEKNDLRNQEEQGSEIKHSEIPRYLEGYRHDHPSQYYSHQNFSSLEQSD